MQTADSTVPSTLEPRTSRDQLMKTSVSQFLQQNSEIRRNSTNLAKPSQRSMSMLSEMEISVRPSALRFNLDTNRHELSRFRKQVETHTDLNAARKNMINWVQPELIISRAMIKLFGIVHQWKSEAFDEIKAYSFEGSGPELNRRSGFSPKIDDSTTFELQRSSTKLACQAVGSKSRRNHRRELNMYFSMDMILKKALKRVFSEIKEYRHQKVVETFEFQILYFNKYTQTFRHHFICSGVGTQTEEVSIMESKKLLRLRLLCLSIEAKVDFYVKASFASIRVQAENKLHEQIDSQINVMQRKINRKMEWSTINERKKTDSQLKFFLLLLINQFERKAIEQQFDAFDAIEKHLFLEKQKAIAIRNIFFFASRSFLKRFSQLRAVPRKKESKEIRFDHASMAKGMYVIKSLMRVLINKTCKEAINQMRMETRPRSRRSIIGISRPSYIGGALATNSKLV